MAIIFIVTIDVFDSRSCFILFSYEIFLLVVMLIIINATFLLLCGFMQVVVLKMKLFKI